MFEVRSGGPEDIADMHRIRMSVRENRVADPARVQVRDYEAMLAFGGCAWVAESDGRVVGFALVDLARSNVWRSSSSRDTKGGASAGVFTR